MNTRQDRTAGEALSPTEHEILALLCSGNDPQSATAREQLSAARWGSYPYEDCECLLLSIENPDALPLIDHDGGPFSMVEVCQDNQGLGFLELWVVDGYLHSIDYMPFKDDHIRLPASDEYNLELLER